METRTTVGQESPVRTGNSNVTRRRRIFSTSWRRILTPVSTSVTLSRVSYEKWNSRFVYLLLRGSSWSTCYSTTPTSRWSTGSRRDVEEGNLRRPGSVVSESFDVQSEEWRTFSSGVVEGHRRPGIQSRRHTFSLVSFCEESITLKTLRVLKDVLDLSSSV